MDSGSSAWEFLSFVHPDLVILDSRLPDIDVSLMIMHTMREISRPDDFLGHLSNTDRILVLPPSNLVALSEKRRARLEQSVEYFYLIKDREQMAKSKNCLGAKLAAIASPKGQFTEANQVKAELLRLKK